MATEARALSTDDIRSIIRQHAPIFGALAVASPIGAEDMSRSISAMVMDNPALLDSVVAAGLDISTEAASKMGLIKWFTAADIAHRTVAAIDVASLMQVFYEELAP